MNRRQHLQALILWPRTATGPHFNPWPVILWRCLWLPVMLVGFITLYIAFLFAFGFREAEKFRIGL